MMLAHVARCCMVAFIFCWAAGCGGSREQPLDDATENLILAQELIQQGDHPAALEKLDASISQQPDAWAYFERAQLHANLGQDDKAASDVQAGLKLDPANEKLKWLQKELKKPKASRFKKDAPQGKSG